jgi:hypothetical protein
MGRPKEEICKGTVPSGHVTVNSLMKKDHLLRTIVAVLVTSSVVQWVYWQKKTHMVPPGQIRIGSLDPAKQLAILSDEDKLKLYLAPQGLNGKRLANEARFALIRMTAARSLSRS